MAITTFGIIGSGWRSEFYQRLGAVLPDVVELVGGATRRPETAEQAASAWGVPVWTTPAELIRSARPDFVITSLPWPINPAVVAELARAGVKVLSETPPAPDATGLQSLWDDVGGLDLVQVAEQYPLMPAHAARREIVRRGTIGAPTSVQVSSTHTYHAIALMRFLLGIEDLDDPVTVNASQLTGALVDPLDRAGWTGNGEPQPATNEIATFDFGDGRSGVYDFTSNQWHNRLRHRRIVVRGSRGEIADDAVVYLADERTVVSSTLQRQQLGHDLNLDGFETESIVFEGTPIWRNPLLGQRLMDEELAIAELMRSMAAWVSDDGPAPYPLARACQDHWLGLAVDESLERGGAVRTAAGPWHR